ncbi:anti-sigma factor family protein [Pseudorhodoferax sp.]|uniref:anti-sigma factor family protein n=1 Tax=Pseudorhodoferax sp. TaxID=1993553 RepID=UPI0039E4867B
MKTSSPVTEAELHALVDGQLAEGRAREVDAYLAAHPHEAHRVAAWRAQNRELHGLFDGVADEPIPAGLLRAARPAARWTTWRLVASVALVCAGGVLGWGLRGELAASRHQSPTAARGEAGNANGFAQRAAVAHAVFVPDQRRAVEIDGLHEDQLVTWLSKRMGSPMHPPRLQALGYTLEGGRLLPGGAGPVAQFMYRDSVGTRLTLYVSNEVRAATTAARSEGNAVPGETAFRFVREGDVNVFYWIDGSFGYALSSFSSRAELGRVSTEVYRQIGNGR